MEEHAEMSHLTKFHAFRPRVNRDQVIDLEKWADICDFHLSFFQMVAE